MEKVLEFGRKYKYLILSGLVILMMIIAGVMVYLFGDKKEEVVEDAIKEEVAVVEPKVDILEEEKEESITIDIKGEVKTPGVYELPLNSRVIDQTTPNMIQRINGIFERNPLISKGI